MRQQASNVWILSDTHLWHESMISSGIRKEGFEEDIVREWNAKVKENDVVIHLGDVEFKNKSSTFFKDLCGDKHLIRGNHDKKSASYYHRMGFSFVGDEYLIMQFGGYLCFLSHKPLHCNREVSVDHLQHEIDIYGPRVLNIHGHLHYPPDTYIRQGKYRGFLDKQPLGSTFLISSELHGYYLHSLKKVVENAEALRIRMYGIKEDLK